MVGLQAACLLCTKHLSVLLAAKFSSVLRMGGPEEKIPSRGEANGKRNFCRIPEVRGRLTTRLNPTELTLVISAVTQSAWATVPH